MIEGVAAAFIVCLLIYSITALFFDDGFGGNHWKIMWFTMLLMRFLGAILALNVLWPIDVKVSFG